MFKFVRNLQIGERFFYKTSCVIYEVLDRYKVGRSLHIKFISDYGKLWDVKKKYDMNIEVILLSGPTTDIPPFLQQSEYRDYLLSYSKNPIELLEMYCNEINLGYSHTIPGIIEQEVKSIRLKDFQHYTGLGKKDFPHIQFNDSNLPLDIMAMQISNLWGVEIDEQTIIDTLIDYPKGYTKAILEPIETKFKQLTGANIQRFAKRFGKKNLSIPEIDDCPF